MKVIGSLKDCYEAQYDANLLLRSKVDSLLNGVKESRWHYESRLKSLESFTQKVETGRFDPRKLEGFFACTLVVENSEAISRAFDLVKRYCEILEKRPRYDSTTRKAPDSFQFDDLRLYVRLKTSPKLPASPLHNIKFEIQIKTYLQHAWSIATHDLVYKSDEISWAQQRIAFQIKATLEAAETAIAGAKDLAKVAGIAVSNEAIDKLIAVVTFLNAKWDKADLPHDIIRLSTVIAELMEATGLTLEEIEASLDRETHAGRGIKLLNLPPYLVVTQSLINTGNDKLKNYLTSVDRRKFKVFIPGEILMPSDYPTPLASRVVGT